MKIMPCLCVLPYLLKTSPQFFVLYFFLFFLFFGLHLKFLKIILYWIIVDLKFVLVLGLQQGESAIHVHISILFFPYTLL